jgi:DNA-binding SARP family transcriptional activator/ABC-type branched-subunit amino acid transport system substrate-binding protein
VLAILLLHANEVVSRARLIEELWGESPPETASTALHGYVSQLRKQLEPARLPGEASTLLITREPGYLLRVEPTEFDLDCFEQLVADGRRDLLDGEPERAIARIDEALAMWRGPPLADLAAESFAQLEAARLEELRVVVLEDRVDAGLALGHHNELVSEIEGLVRRHPLRERLRGQLMLALYRSGRQADALRAYQEARRTLVEQLGIEPGQALHRLERAILEQDPSLELTSPAEPPQTADAGARAPAASEANASSTALPLVRSWRRATVVALSALLVAAGAAALGFQILRDGASADSPPLRGNSVALLDPETDHVVRGISVGEHPTSIAVGEGAIWVLNGDDQTISRIDERTGAVETFGIGETPNELAAGAGAVWVAIDGETNLVRLDPGTGVVDARIPLSDAVPTATGGAVTSAGTAIAVSGNAVWAVNNQGTVSRIDPETNRVVTSIRTGGANTLAVDGRTVWVVNFDSTVTPIDEATNTVGRRIAVPSNSLTAAAAGAGSLWLTDPIGGMVWRVEPGGSRVIMRSIPVGFGAAGTAFGNGSVWVSNGLENTVTRIDPETNDISATIKLANPPQSIATGRDGVWFTVGGSSATPASRATQDLPEPPCSAVFYEGPGKPRFLIASDLPLQGGSRANALSMIEATRLVLRDHDFKAGPFSVGHQFCDDATAQAAGFEIEKCASNASAYVAHRRVLGVIGSYNSDCSGVQIAIANRGSLAMISPSNSSIGLTRAAPSSPHDQLRRLYPTGRRNYARVYPADDVQAAADAIFARRLGCEAIFVLDDGRGGYALDMAESFVRAAGELRLRVAGAQRWDPEAGSYRALSRRIRRSGADCVFLAGQVNSNGGRLLQDLRSSLGAEAPILASDGFSNVDGLVESAGAAARGLYVSVAGVPTDRLGPVGEQFIRQLRDTRPAGAEPNLYWGAYAAQSAELLLDAIARSDGTRPSVTKQLLATQVEDGILGDVRFDGNGDVVPSPITILRVKRGGQGMSPSTTDWADGAIVERVITPPPRLVQ